METLINKLKEIENLSELKNINEIDSNRLLYAIAKSRRFDLLSSYDVKINFDNRTTLEKLIDFLITYDDDLYDMIHNGFLLSSDDLDKVFNIVSEKYKDDYKFDNFFRGFFSDKTTLNDFTKRHNDFFEQYIKEKGELISYKLRECDYIISLMLNCEDPKLIKNIETYSPENLKLLAEFLRKGNEIPYYLGNELFEKHLFDCKDELEPIEFNDLMNLLKDQKVYARKSRNTEETIFSKLVSSNIDYLINMVSSTKNIPQCLTESKVFRDECIKRNRIDLAVKCVLSIDILQNEELAKLYCNELNIDTKDFYERSKWLLNYYEKNNNVFNTILATSIKNGIFSLNKEHYERFINDVNVQIMISKLNPIELEFLNKVSNLYNYKDYDISPMIINVINNISNYKDLIESVNIYDLSEQDFKKIISIMQLPNNEYHIQDLNSVRQIDIIKQQTFTNNFATNDLTKNKDNLVKILFNISLNEAIYISSKYCHDNNDNNVLDSLKDSELPKEIYDYLKIIDQIVECKSKDELTELCNNFNNIKIYNQEIPFESYLRGKYTELYSKSIYRIDEKKNVYGPNDSIHEEIEYNGNKIQICVPREKFNFFVHCIGYCSLKTDVVDNNYKTDWLDRPQLQDHFVACSYFNEKGIYSIVSQDNVIFGFDSLENGAILGMGNTDIDSIGYYANSYSGSRILQEGNGQRARYFVPSQLLKTINRGYNEVVVERRNTNKEKNNETKRKPDYIVMMAESMEQSNFNFLETLYQNQLSFVSEEDKNTIKEINNKRQLKDFLSKYNQNILENAKIEGISSSNMIDKYVDLITKAKYYEECLKASSEFDIPLVVIDKTYYFNKMLSESIYYDDETTRKISELYSNSDNSQKKKLYNMVAQEQDVSLFLQPKQEQHSIRI